MSTPVAARVAVIGGGVVGCAVTWALAGRGATAVLLEAKDELARGASGTNSGILHTGFDSPPGTLETQLILRSALLRDPVLARLGVPVMRCGARLRPRDAEESRTVAALAEGARGNGVAVSTTDDGSLVVPGESVTDPVAYTRGLAAAAEHGGAEVRTGARVEAIERRSGSVVLRTADGARVEAAGVVNCAGLQGDEVARLAGDRSFEVFPRKGEFFVFEPPGDQPLGHIHLPVPTTRTKGILVFPTMDGKVIVGPTAHDQSDKHDRSVRETAFAEVMPKAVAMVPALEGADPIAAYAGLRPAGRGCNYVIERSNACPELVNVAAIRSTGLTASLGIAERVVALLAAAGIGLGPQRELPAAAAGPEIGPVPWWRRAADMGGA